MRLDLALTQMACIKDSHHMSFVKSLKNPGTCRTSLKTPAVEYLHVPPAFARHNGAFGILGVRKANRGKRVILKYLVQ